MTDHYWIPITPDVPWPKGEFLTRDEYGTVFVGDSTRDYWDSMEYWFPMPKVPFAAQGFASADALNAIIKKLDK